MPPRICRRERPHLPPSRCQPTRTIALSLLAGGAARCSNDARLRPAGTKPNLFNKVRTNTSVTCSECTPIKCHPLAGDNAAHGWQCGPSVNQTCPSGWCCPGSGYGWCGTGAQYCSNQQDEFSNGNNACPSPPLAALTGASRRRLGWTTKDLRAAGQQQSARAVSQSDHPPTALGGWHAGRVGCMGCMGCAAWWLAGVGRMGGVPAARSKRFGPQRACGVQVWCGSGGAWCGWRPCFRLR